MTAAAQHAARYLVTLSPGVRVWVAQLQATHAAPRPVRWRGVPDTAGRIAGVICAAYGVTRDTVIRRGKRRAAQHARAAIAYWLRRRCGYSYTMIGRVLGYADHTTAIYAVKKHTERKAARVALRTA